MTAQLSETPVPTERDPLTDRGRRTRESLLGAARTAFEAKGYAATRMSDIAAAAGVSHGTVYTYFPDKPAVFKAVVHALTEQLDSEWTLSGAASDPVGRIAEANARYLESFTRHVRLLQVVEEAGMQHPEYAKMLDDFRHRYVERAVAGIRRLQRDGDVRKDLDPYLAGSALCAMVEGFGRQWIGRDEHHDPDVVNDTLTRLWAQALDLPTTR